MRINPDFTIQKVGSTYIAVPVGETSKDFHVMVRLNETGAFIWQKLTERDLTEEELVDALLAEYEVPREVAARDIHTVLESLRPFPILL